MPSLSSRAQIEADFRRDIQPLVAVMRRQFEAEDAALLAMHPGHPDNRRSRL